MANLHRLLSDTQLDVPPDLAERARKDPLAFAALLLQSQRDFNAATTDFQDMAIQGALRLRDALEARYGKDWPKKLDLPPLFPEADK
jgi:hypothetical protein